VINTGISSSGELIRRRIDPSVAADLAQSRLLISAVRSN
jgi:hypothetical protein